jgi:hypothetical protein
MAHGINTYIGRLTGESKKKEGQRGENTQTPIIKGSFTAISRKNYVVYLNDLEQWQFLKALQRQDNYFTAVSAAAENCRIT